MDDALDSRRLRRARERADLAKAERDLVEGEMRITRQVLRVETLRAAGHDTGRAERQLAILESTLAEWRTHRAEILRTLALLRDP